MSTFGGRMCLYHYVSIDRFDGDNLSSLVYFLSHCHQDHMVGLGSDALHRRLQSRRDIRLYCHEITAQLLIADARYEHLRPYIETIECGEEPMSITIRRNGNDDEPTLLWVSAIGAGHCPGSVMFLFDGDDGLVLYTGDFRVDLDDIRMSRQLHDPITGEAHRLRAMYFDSTFCFGEKANYIQPRQQTLSHIIDIAYQWLNDSHLNKVFVYCYANYGHEFLLRGISEHFGMPFHVSDGKYKALKGVQSLSDCLTCDGSSTRLHACQCWDTDTIVDDDVMMGSQGRKRKKRRLGNGCEHCQLDDDKHVMIIKPSMLFFLACDKNKQVWRSECRRFVRVKYSMHASLAEVQSIVSYLRPSILLPTVVPGHTSVEAILVNFADLLPRRPPSTYQHNSILPPLPRHSYSTSASVANGNNNKSTKLRRTASAGENGIDDDRCQWHCPDFDSSPSITPSSSVEIINVIPAQDRY